jgi:hypothetical protein
LAVSGLSNGELTRRVVELKGVARPMTVWSEVVGLAAPVSAR